MVVDHFRLDWELTGKELLLSIDTDLPDEAELIVSVRRGYSQEGRDAAYSRGYFSARERVALWREPRRIPLNAAAWTADLNAHRDEMAKLGEGFAFAVDSIEDEIQVGAVLHMDQDDRRFGGRGNPKLSGKAVSSRGNSKLVEAEVKIRYPLEGPAPTGHSRFVSAGGLEIGGSYKISEETPLMPAVEPADPLAALEQVVHLEPGTVIRVIGTANGHMIPWYEVAVRAGGERTGWINGIALIGQDIERQ